MTVLSIATPETETTQEQWLEKRKGGIGGSDIGAIIGLDKYRSPLDVYLAKVEGKKVDDNYNMRLGRQMESIVADEFALATGFAVYEPDTRIVEHPETPHFLASVDRFYTRTDGSRGVLECKTTSRFIDKDDINLSWIAQAQWYMYVYGLQYASIAWIGGGLRFDYFEIERDERFINYMATEATRFWLDYVLPKLPPPATSAEDVKLIYPKHQDGTSLELAQESLAVVEEYKSYQARIKELEEKAEELKNRIIVMFGQFEKLTYAGRDIATFKSPKDSLKFDQTQFKAEHPELYQQYCKTAPNSRRLLIK